MRHLKRLTVLAAAASTTMAAAAAMAATTAIDDPTGDVSGNPPGSASKHDVDITKATAGTDGKKVKLTVKVKGSIKVALKRIDTSPAFLLAKKGDNQPSFDVFGTTPPGYTAQNFHGDSTPAKVNTPTKHKAVVTFNPKPIGLPAKYRWQALTGLCAPLDQAPNHGWASGETAKRC